MNKNKMNRKGDISTLLLVIGVFLVCAVAIFSFTLSNGGNKGSFSNVVGNMAAANIIADKIRFYENVGQDPTEFLDITRQGDKYLINLNEIDDGERKFGVQYIIEAKAQSPQ